MGDFFRGSIKELFGRREQHNNRMIGEAPAEETSMIIDPEDTTPKITASAEATSAEATESEPEFSKEDWEILAEILDDKRFFINYLWNDEYLAFKLVIIQTLSKQEAAVEFSKKTQTNEFPNAYNRAVKKVKAYLYYLKNPEQGKAAGLDQQEQKLFEECIINRKPFLTYWKEGGLGSISQYAASSLRFSTLDKLEKHFNKQNT